MIPTSAKGAAVDGERRRNVSFARPIRTSWACAALWIGFQSEQANRSRLPVCIGGSYWRFKEGAMDTLAAKNKPASIGDWNSHRWAGITRTYSAEEVQALRGTVHVEH